MRRPAKGLMEIPLHHWSRLDLIAYIAKHVYRSQSDTYKRHLEMELAEQPTEKLLAMARTVQTQDLERARKRAEARAALAPAEKKP